MTHNTIPVGDDVRRLTLMILFCLLPPVLCPPTSTAAQQAWVAKYSNGPNTTNQPVGMGLDSDGNIYIGGHSTRPNAPYDFDYVVVKYSPLGEQLWANRFGSPGLNDKVVALAVSPEGDVVMTGTTNTVKYLSSGLLAWTAPYAGRDITLDSSGNSYVTGFRTDVYSLVKIAPAGTNLWLRTPDYSPSNDISQVVTTDPFGNVFIGGLVNIWCPSTGCTYATVIVKYDADGSVVWERFFLQDGMWSILSEYKGFACDAQGDLYVAMNLQFSYPWMARKITFGGEYSWLKSLNNIIFREGVMAMTLDGNGNAYYTGSIGGGIWHSLKLTLGGTNLWEAQYGGTPQGSHRGNAIAADTAGNAYVTGLSLGFGTGNDYATVKYGPNGQQLWVKRFTEAGNSDDQAHAIAVNQAGDVYVTGFSNPTNGLYEITTIKYIQLAPIEKKTDGAILLSFCGAPGSNYTLQASTTLTNWSAIGSVTADPNGLYTFEDTNVPSYPQRFYRTLQE